MKGKSKENIDMSHVNQTTTVTALDAKLASLRHRHDELEAKVSRWATYFNPHGVLDNWTEEERWEAEINLPTVKAELAQVKKEMKPLGIERDRVIEAEKKRIRSALDDERREKLTRLAVVLEEAGKLNKKIYDLEMSYETKGCGAIVDFHHWPELLPNETSTWTPPLVSRLRAWRENGWLS